MKFWEVGLRITHLFLAMSLLAERWRCYRCHPETARANDICCLECAEEAEAVLDRALDRRADDYRYRKAGL